MFQSVLMVTQSRMAVCMHVPPIIPPQMPCGDAFNSVRKQKLDYRIDDFGMKYERIYW